LEKGRERKGGRDALTLISPGRERKREEGISQQKEFGRRDCPEREPSSKERERERFRPERAWRKEGGKRNSSSFGGGKRGKGRRDHLRYLTEKKKGARSSRGGKKGRIDIVKGEEEGKEIRLLFAGN